MTEKKSSSDSQIYPFEIFAIIWSHKLLIVICIIFSISWASYKLSGMEREYTAVAIFKLENSSTNSNASMTNEVGAIAAIAGLGSVQVSNTDVLLERMMNKEFILHAIRQLSLEDDAYFNTYNAPAIEPWWKLKIKSFRGLHMIERNHSQYVTSSIVSNYLKNVKAQKTEADAIVISFTHKDAKKAAKYANLLIKVVNQLTVTEKEAASNERLAYLSETLADALQEVETSEQKLKVFLLKNNVRADERIEFSSQELDKLRMERKEVSEISHVLKVIKEYINKGVLNNSSYKKLRSKYPLIDAIKFRQIL